MILDVLAFLGAELVILFRLKCYPRILHDFSYLAEIFFTHSQTDSRFLKIPHMSLWPDSDSINFLLRYDQANQYNVKSAKIVDSIKTAKKQKKVRTLGC